MFETMLSYFLLGAPSLKIWKSCFPRSKIISNIIKYLQESTIFMVRGKYARLLIMIYVFIINIFKDTNAATISIYKSYQI